MAYPTICDECLEGDCAHCEEGTINPEREALETYNRDKPAAEMVIGGAFCVCRHGEEEGDFERDVWRRVGEGRSRQG